MSGVALTVSNEEPNRGDGGQIGDQIPGLGVDPGLIWRTQLLRRLIVGQTIAVSVLTLMVTVAGLVAPEQGTLALAPLGVIAALVGLIAYWLLSRERWAPASYVFLLGTAVAITSNVFVRGFQDVSAIYYLWPIMGAVFLLGTRGGMAVTGASALLYLGLVVLQSLRLLPVPLPLDAEAQAAFTVTSRLLMFLLLAFLGILISQSLDRALGQARDTAQRWRDLSATLEQRVTDRTRELERRTEYLQATADVSRATGSILDTEELAKQVVEMVRRRFNLYYVGLFMIDHAQEWAILKAGTGAAGRAMVERGHRIRVGEGMVGWTVAHDQARVAQAGEEDTPGSGWGMRLATPELPETRSEAALPLRSRGRVLGALTVQHVEPGVFDESSVAVLQTMADQVALALDNAQLFTASQEALEGVQQAYGEMSRQSWVELLSRWQQKGYRYAAEQVSELVGEVSPEMYEAEQTGQMVVGTRSDGVEDRPAVAVPLKVRDTIVGVMGFRKKAGGGDWSQEERQVLTALVGQLEVALEGARLYQDTQRRAAHERLLGEVTARVRETLDIETVMRTAAVEIREALGLPEVAVRLLQVAPAVDGRTAAARDNNGGATSGG
ncbi:MAG TPA: GAF domain-containing protein [Anaerolineae bacterium]|nr:GAF domain-containing protein [Anaerolineae bacterium]